MRSGVIRNSSPRFVRSARRNTVLHEAKRAEARLTNVRCLDGYRVELIERA